MQYMYSLVYRIVNTCFYVGVCECPSTVSVSVPRVNRIGVEGLFALCECVRLSQGNDPVRLGSKSGQL